MYTDNVQIGSLSFMLREERRDNAASIYTLQSFDHHGNLPLALSLSPVSANFLMHAYISNVDQFIRVIHKPTLLKQRNQLRRGVLSESHEFQCQLSTIYSLASLSISDDDSIARIGMPRDVLLHRLRLDTELALTTLNVTTTHKLSTLQTLILHIVRFYTMQTFQPI